MTALGDLFMRDGSGHFHFLDLLCGECKQVATSFDEFDRLCDGEEQRQSWFAADLVADLAKIHGELLEGQCFSCKVPISLGGKLAADNFQSCDIQVHYSVLGQLHQQTRHLPSGTKIGGVKIEIPDGELKPKKSWWQRVTDVRG
jgi:hypothetical protein